MSEQAEQTIDLNQLVKRLPPGKLGQFEPVSGIIVLNIDRDSYSEMVARWVDGKSTEGDRLYIRTINHETHHFVQTALTGYMFDRARRLFSAFNAEDLAVMQELEAIERDAQAFIEQHKALVEDDPESIARLVDIATVAYHHNRAGILAKYAKEGDHSLVGAVMPEFFEFREKLIAQETQANADGLSILGLVEGAAVIYCALFTGDDAKAIAEIEDEIATLPPLYHEFWGFLKDRAEERAIELALSLAAIALCYERPHMACGPILERLLESPAGEGVQRASEIFEVLPDIPEAGRRLGIGRRLRDADDSYRIYDTALEAWETDPSEPTPFELLSHPLALNEVKAIPAPLTLSDGFVSGQLSPDEAHARIMIASMVLRVQSRRREEKDYQNFAARWGQSVLHRMLGTVEMTSDDRDEEQRDGD